MPEVSSVVVITPAVPWEARKHTSAAFLTEKTEPKIGFDY
jgi:hypothetical protein